jgi:hypothetical protein
MERSPNVAIIPHHGQGHVHRANHTANVTVGMGDSGGATAYPPRQPTRRRRDATNRRLPATPGGVATKGATKATRTNKENNSNKDKKPQQHGQAQKRQDIQKLSADGPPPCKRFLHLGKNSLSGEQHANVQIANTPKVQGKYKAINHLLE